MVAPDFCTTFAHVAISSSTKRLKAAGALIPVGGEGVAHCPRRVENVFESRPDARHLAMRVRFKGRDYLGREETKMRTIALVLAAFVASGPTAAQDWKEYSYPDYSFTVAFPATPQIETTTYQVADRRSVPAHVYTVRQDNSVLKVTVAELANTGLDESAIIGHAIKTLSAGGEVKFDIPHRIYNVYGRQLSVLGADGSRSTVAVFDYKGRLYQIEARALPGRNDTAADTLRFQQSLVFTDGGSNRSADTIRAIREACRGSAFNPAGVDDPRCPGAARK
jgi:hypothetical protein